MRPGSNVAARAVLVFITVCAVVCWATKSDHEHEHGHSQQRRQQQHTLVVHDPGHDLRSSSSILVDTIIGTTLGHHVTYRPTNDYSDLQVSGYTNDRGSSSASAVRKYGFHNVVWLAGLPEVSRWWVVERLR